MSERICGSGIATWTEARDTRLRYLAEAGLSFRQIAADIGVSRNSAIGRAHRLGIKTINPPPTKDHRDQPKTQCNGGAIIFSIKAKVARESKAYDAPRTEAMCLPPEPQRDPVPFLDLHPNSCRWPICDDADNTLGFCGADRRDETTHYCARHHRMAYRPIIPLGERVASRPQIKRTVISGQFV
jgi:GcrA cell cycle regulator